MKGWDLIWFPTDHKDLGLDVLLWLLFHTFLCFHFRPISIWWTRLTVCFSGLSNLAIHFNIMSDGWNTSAVGDPGLVIWPAISSIIYIYSSIWHFFSFSVLQLSCSATNFSCRLALLAFSFVTSVWSSSLPLSALVIKRTRNSRAAFSSSLIYLISECFFLCSPVELFFLSSRSTSLRQHCTFCPAPLSLAESLTFS